jgi:hypothetical protein
MAARIGLHGQESWMRKVQREAAGTGLSDHDSENRTVGAGDLDDKSAGTGSHDRTTGTE